MKKPVIGITSNEKTVSADGLMVHSSVSRNFAKAVIQAGGIPIHIPVCQPEMVKDYIQLIDKLILSGGQDVQPSHYGSQQLTLLTDYFPERDLFELALAKEALDQKKPILGVCRGLQVFNTLLGGTLHQDIQGHQFDNLEDFAHKIRLENNNALLTIFGQNTSVNSHHHQSLDQLASGLSVIARDSLDGTIEAVQSTRQHTFIGVQWHPEYLLKLSSKQQQLFDYFVKQV